jgi:hypothetical protein
MDFNLRANPPPTPTSFTNNSMSIPKSRHTPHHSSVGTSSTDKPSQTVALWGIFLDLVNLFAALGGSLDSPTSLYHHMIYAVSRANKAT